MIEENKHFYTPIKEPVPITEQQWPKETLPLVVARITTYNHEPYIRHCIEGVLMQKTTFPVSVAILEDFSTDKTAEIIKEYESKHPKLITALYMPFNTYGKPERRELAKPIVEETQKAKYIAICEGDDYWIDPLKLQKQVDFLEQNPDYSMCFHNAIIYENTYKRRHVFLFNKFNSDRDLTIDDIVCKWVVPTASMVYRKKYSARPDWMTLIYSGDYSLLLALYLKGKMKYLDSVSSIYRKHFTESSVSTNTDSNFVRNQHILLLESFNQGTKYKYDSVISHRINSIKKEIALREALKKHKYYKLLFMLPQIWNNGLRILKHRLKRIN